ncbi:ATP-binding cassette sub-family A member 3-like 1 [Homarus americanus]|uniref:ATP-binding cassette sub-family A member 3-like 1 n=1 Tax=Homarus americanus TaxID=6706 RepID=A0A8J5JZ07_HOMAM|nr:ATP-binding cassette sub-family A member 3-like 1 [Homarus americanus]
MKRGSSGLHKFWLLLWKNWILQRRRKIQTLVEVLLPVVFCVLLVVIRDLAPYGIFLQPTYYKPFEVSQLPANLTPNDNGGFFSEWAQQIFSDDSSERRRRSLSASESQDPMWPIAYSPNNTVITKLMELVSTRLNIDERGLGFANEEDLVDRLTTFTKEEENEEVEDILGGIVFTNEFPKDDVLPENIQYKIRLKGSLRSFTKRNPFLPPPQWYTELSYPLYQVPGPRDRTNNHGGRPGYYTEGFLALQHAVDMAIAEYFTGTNPDVHYVVEMQRMPYPPFIDDKYLVALQAWLPFVLLLSYIYPAINIVKSVVYEKEKKLKESMKMMGLQNWLHWLAWFTKTFMFLATSTVFITILLHGPGSLAVLSESDPTLVFVFLLLYTTCSVCFCFFLSTLFSKANSAAAVTGLIWFFTYVPYMILRPRYSSLTMTSKIMLCLLSNTAMSLGCQLTSMFEGVGSGIQWDLLFTGVSPDDSFTLGHVFGMFILDIIIFLLLTWYIEAVWPGEFGVPKPWYFPFMSSYWLGRNSEDWHQSIINPCVADASLFEEDPQGIPAGVQVEGLTKVFPRGRNVAVNNMFLNMYDGQITVLLGHNGAGKTTTMSMLTGLYPPTSGTARVGGYDIVSQMVEVRHSLGLCPQHDVLFDELTVAEHIKFFSKLKGLSNAKAEAEVSSILEKLKLQDKIDATPTSGMDPGARRLIWDLLQEERSGRTILLTTHFMEEADLLGDRIAIMANGVVQCCGSSLFLKRKYEAGYRLIIVKAKGCDVHAITDVLQSHIPDAELDQNVGAELSYVLPNADVAKFEALFLQLETQKEDLMISSYGAVGEATDPDIIGHLHKVIPSSLKNRANSALDGVGKENGLLLDIEQGDSLEEVQTDDTPQVQGRAAATWFNAAIQRVTFVLENVTALQLLQTNNYTDHLEEAVKLHFIHRNKLKMVEPDFNFSTFILDQTQSDIPSFNQHWMVALQIEGVKYGAHILAMFNNQPFHTPPLALTIADTAVIRAVTGNKNITIATSNHPLPRTDIEKLTQDQRQNLGFQIGFNLAFGMSFLAASFLFGLKGLSEGEQLARIMLVFVHYAWVTLPLMYLCSFLFTVPSAGFTRMIIINIISGMATVITVTILRIPDLELGHVADMLDWIFLLFPSYAMAAAITDVYSNYRSTEICKRSTVSLICTLGIAPNPCCREADNCGSFGCVDWNEDFLSWEKLGIGRMLVFMGVEGILFYILIALTELKVFQTIRYSLSRIWHKVAIKPWRDVELEGDSMNPEDEDVKAERLRIRDTPLDQLQETEKLIFRRDLCKTYNGDFVAVDHLNLGVPLGECFGLLGINGAGKTTTFKMLTGDLPVSSGDAFVNGYSIKSDMKNVQQQIGYCPQFDALHDHMTGREALRMFARLRGVPERQINGMIAVLADQLLVTQHLDNLFGNYSGGNKRKLSTGVALVGDPPLVLLDEPSSGMDPVARRLLWDVLTSVRDAGRSIILTSHSMEECEALCTRLAIMVNGKFCCLGSPQHLKSKFSEGYSVIIRVHMSNSQETNHLREIQWGRLEYFIPAEGLTWASVFGTIERNRQELPIDDYSVTQTTLERQVFLTFTRGQRPEGIDR